MWHFSPDDFLAGGSSQQLVVAGGWRIREESGNAGLFVSVDLSLTFPRDCSPLVFTVPSVLTCAGMGCCLDICSRNALPVCL